MASRGAGYSELAVASAELVAVEEKVTVTRWNLRWSSKLPEPHHLLHGPFPLRAMPADRPVSLRDLDVERHLGNPEIRQAFVTPMFDLIAPRYDDFTRIFSLGMDQGWK